MNEFMLGRPRDGLDELKRATELAANDADAFYYLGRLEFSVDNSLAALSAFQKSLALDGTSIRTQNQLGQTYEAMGRFEEAEKAYLKAIEMERSQAKKSEWPYFNLGVLYLNSGRAPQAVSYLEDALRRNSSWAQGKVKLGAALDSCGKSQQALVLLQEAVRSEPQNAEAHYRLALLLTRSGNTDEAQKHFDAFEHLRKR
jgi:tetratricopeptide (TPR) repeat protein